MTNAQLSKALSLAQSKQLLTDQDIQHFDGFGLADFQPITCTVPQLARLVRWQCIRWNGSVDAEALNEIAECGRRKFIVLDEQ